MHTNQFVDQCLLIPFCYQRVVDWCKFDVCHVVRHAVETLLRLLQSMLWQAIAIGLFWVLNHEWVNQSDTLNNVKILKKTEQLWILHYAFWILLGVNLPCLMYIQTLNNEFDRDCVKTFINVKHEFYQLHVDSRKVFKNICGTTNT